MLTIEDYRALFAAHLKHNVSPKEPKGLYEPAYYILTMEGKRLRPVLTLMIAEIFGANYKIALDAASAIELFHNFTLIHDDIMDNAPLRRGQKTVHEKWNINTGILSGDIMLVMAHQYLESYPSKIFKKLSVLFHETAAKVCEGQQYDVDFETRADVSIAEYLKMIAYKTGVLVATAMKMGAIIAKASSKEAQYVYDFGLNLGVAFQLNDDYLDVFGDAAAFGKQIGGDIVANKKTFLYLSALNHLSKEDAAYLQQRYAAITEDATEKINAITHLFSKSNVDKHTLAEIENYTQKAFTCLERLKIRAKEKRTLKNVATALMNRRV